MTPAERRLRAKSAALTRWSRTNLDQRKALGQRGQRGLERQWITEIDPAGDMDPRELAVLLTARRRAHMADLARRSIAARKRAA